MNLHVETIVLLIMLFIVNSVNCFWDLGTTTPGIARTDTHLRTSFFRWQKVDFLGFLAVWYPAMDWVDITNRRRLCMVAGISIDFLPLSTATILNTRILLTSANYLDPHLDRQKDLRIWALGRAGMENTPYRYRVWRVWRLLPRSLNPEHQHGTRGAHIPRHDLSVIVSWDRLYIFAYYSGRYLYAYRATLVGPHETLTDDLLYAGSGYEYLTHVYDNYKIFYTTTNTSYIVDCSKYLPKWWGKFICIKNVHGFPGIQNGGPLFSGSVVVGVGCFEIRYNEDRIFVFTDVRYYVYLIYKYSDIRPGDYYEYAYPQWYIKLGYVFDGNYNYRYIPTKQLSYDLFPLGK